MTVPTQPVTSLKVFWRSVGVVLTGAAVAQSIPLLGALVIARLYAPAEFGLFSAWLGMVMIAAVVVTGRFEMALAVEPDGAPRRFAMVATLVMTLLVSALIGVSALAALVSGRLPDQVNLGVVTLWVLAASLVGVTHTWQAWAAAEGNYRGLSWIRIAQAIIITGAQIVAGLISPTAFGMMLGYFLGLAVGIVCAIYVMPVWLPEMAEEGDLWLRLKEFWYRQRRFPLLALPADTINAASGQLPLLFIASRFGAEASGLYALTVRILGAPISLLGAAVLDVFKRQAATSYREKGNCKEEYTRTFWLLAAGGLGLALGVVLLAEQLFVVAFGEPWRYAGTIALWLIPMFVMRFVASPLSYVLYIAGKQHVDLAWQCALLLVTVAAFLSFSHFDTSVQLYAAAYSSLYIIYAMLSYRYSKGGLP